MAFSMTNEDVVALQYSLNSLTIACAELIVIAGKFEAVYMDNLIEEEDPD